MKLDFCSLTSISSSVGFWDVSEFVNKFLGRLHKFSRIARMHCKMAQVQKQRPAVIMFLDDSESLVCEYVCRVLSFQIPRCVHITAKIVAIQSTSVRVLKSQNKF